MNEIVKIFKILGIVGVVIGALNVLGNAVNYLVPWEILTNIFVIFRKLLLSIDFVVDTQALLAAITASLSILLAKWAYQATMFVVNFFKQMN